MNKKLIENTLHEIVTMDYEASQKEKALLTVEREREATLRKVRRELEFEIMKTARKAAKAEVKALNQETSDLVEALDQERLSETAILNEKMEAKRQEIVQQIFEEIFHS